MITFAVRFILIACVPSLLFLAVRVAVVEKREAHIRRDTRRRLRQAGYNA